MKKAIALLLIVICTCAVLGIPAAADAKKVTVATAGDVRPFAYENKGKLTGYDIEVIKAAKKFIKGYQITFTKTSWKSIFAGLDSGRYQMAANNLSYTKERGAKYLYSLPIAKNPLVLAVPKHSDINSLEDIGGKTTQDDTGTSTAKLVEDWNKKHSQKPSKIAYSGEDATKRMMDLEAGEFDYLIFDKVSVETVIKQKGLRLKTIELKTDDNPNNYIVFSNDSKNLQKQFNRALKRLWRTGRLKDLSQKYLGGVYLPDKKEWEKAND